MLAESAVVDHERNLIVQAQAAHVQIDRTKETESAVNDQALGMKEPAGKLLDLDAGAEQIVHVAAAGITHQHRIDTLRHNQGDIHATRRGRLQSLKDGIIRHKIGRRHDDFMLRFENRIQQYMRHISEFIARA